jgi:hypothetical protein
MPAAGALPGEAAPHGGEDLRVAVEDATADEQAVLKERFVGRLKEALPGGGAGDRSGP